MEKNNSLVIWRIIYTYCIAIYHLFNAYGIGTSLYIATDFFFIVSGYLLAEEAEKKRWNDTLDLLVYKLKKLYPHYLFSLIVAYFVFRITKVGLYSFSDDIILELLLLQMIGVNVTEAINVPTWYISVLLVCSCLIYFVLINYKKIYVNIFAPLIIIIIFTWHFRNFGYINHIVLGEDVTTSIYWNRPLLLGMAFMSLGVLGHELNNKYKKFRGGERI